MGEEGRPAWRRSVDEHREAVRQLFTRVVERVMAEYDDVPLRAACGRVLARDVHTPGSLPPFDNAQMDGYAVNAADLARLAGGQTRARLSVTATIPAGPARTAPALEPGTAAPIMTGAPLPPGADAVVPVESAEPPRFGAGDTVSLPLTLASGQVVEPGLYVRRAGSDVAAGALVLTAGTALTPRHLGLAAGLGLPTLAVRRAPRALVVATGEEIVPPGEALGPGQIHDANTTLLAAALEADGWDVTTAAIATDEPGAFLSRLEAAVRQSGADMVLTSGGISQGAFEVVKLALAERGLEFGSVRMQPGGPQGAGWLSGLGGTDVGGSAQGSPGAREAVADRGPGVAVLAFPGNPVSGYVSYEMFLRPAAVDALGLDARLVVEAELAEPLSSPAGKVQVRRARLIPASTPGPNIGSAESGDGRHPRVELVGGPGSHLLHALAEADALAIVPAEATELPAGSRVTVIVLPGHPAVSRLLFSLPTKS